ncbi:MAG TPA: hypothetical protein DCQ76_00345 [Ruminococcaceae bacterium]|nr:hypothetical protein [Oscillospiraceae bacterium]
MKIVTIICGLLFLGFGIPMVSGKAENFVVGSASPDNELRKNFDTKKLCRIFGIYLIFVAVFTALLGFFFNREFFTAYFICVLAGALICIVTVALTCRKKSE